MPLYWSTDTVKDRLGPSHIVQSILSYQKTVEAKYRSLNNIKTIPLFFTPDPDDTTAHVDTMTTSTTNTTSAFTFTNYQWATAILDSRSIWWAGLRHLVPMLDLVNCAEDERDPSAIHSTVLSTDKMFAITKAGMMDVMRCDVM